MEVVTAIVGPIVNILVGHIKQEVGYLISYKKNVIKLKSNIDELESNRADVQMQVDANDRNSIINPETASKWLDDVKSVNGKLQSIPDDVAGCLNLKQRYVAGKKASKGCEEINGLIIRRSEIIWPNALRPLGKVESQKESTSAQPGGPSMGFKSRISTFNSVLKALQPADKIRMLGLCGMGGVGKTTMMEELKKAAEDKKLFDWIVKVVIGEKPNLFIIQKAIAACIGVTLEEDDLVQRAARLYTAFKGMSKDGTCKILLIFDDVWTELDLVRLIGFSPLADEWFGFKVLLTSRNGRICTKMGGEANHKTFPIDAIPYQEGLLFFCQITNISIDDNAELYKIAEEIVRRCGGLPLAIKTIGKALLGESKIRWDKALLDLENSDLDEDVSKILQVSFDFLKSDEVKAIFLLCCLFPENADIPIEDVTRYCVGLRLFDKFGCVWEARIKAESYVDELQISNLLTSSDKSGCVKMHDVLRAFGLGIASKDEFCSLVEHGNNSEWPTKDTYEPYTRISLSCSNMLEFPEDLNFPKLMLLKLMNGTRSLRFPKDFYGQMGKVRVISYEQMHYPLFPASSQLLANLRVLCLNSCQLMYECDLSIIGNLQSLEILSFAGCRITRLPSSIGQLKKLKLLDVSRCQDLMIDDGVLGGLIRLEELYLRDAFQNATISNCKELEKLYQTLTTLEIEFCGNGARPKAVHFKNLKRFQISMGCYLDEVDCSFRNTLRLKANKSEVLACEINGLFQKTGELHLEVQGINHLGDVSGASDFSNLKLLEVNRCAELVHLVDATGGRPCNVFPVTNSLFLSDLNNFEGICLGSPQHLMFKNLRVLKVCGCGKLKYVLSRSLAIGLDMLESLDVSDCENMEEIVHEEDDDEIGEAEVIMFPLLRVMKLEWLPKLVGMSKSKNVVFPQLVELRIEGISRVTSIYGGDEMEAITSSASPVQPLFRNKVAIPMLEILKISKMESLMEIWRPSQYDHSKDICTLRKMDVSECDKLFNVFPTNPIPQLHHLEELRVDSCGSLEVIFDMNFKGKESNNIHQCHENEREKKGFSSLKQIYVSNSYALRHVWRMKGVNNFGDHIIQGFQALTSIRISYCNNFRHLFAPSIANFNLEGLEDIEINECTHLGGSGGSNNILVESESSSSSQEVLSDQEMTVVVNNVLIPTFQSLKSLCLSNCKIVKVVFDMESCGSRDLRSANDRQLILPHLTQLELTGMDAMIHVWKWKKLSSLEVIPILQQSLAFHNLTDIHLRYCGSIKYLFSPLMAKLLVNLHTVNIGSCRRMEEIVSNGDDGGDGCQEMTTTFFPRLDTLKLHSLPNLKRIGGGGGGINAVNSNTTNSIDKPNAQVAVASWSCQHSRKIEINECNTLSSVIPCHAVEQLQKLQKLKISKCKSIVEVFEAEGNGAGGTTMTIPMLRVMTLSSLRDLMYIWRNQMLRFPNLTKLYISYCGLLGHIFTYSTIESLQQLKELKIHSCTELRVIVKEDDEEHTTAASGMIMKTTTKVLVFPNLQSLTLNRLWNLKGFSLGMHDFQWPMLDKVEIFQCPKMTVFAYGHSTTPKLKYIRLDLDNYSLDGDLNFDMTTASHKTQFPISDGSSLCPTLERVKQLRFPWSLSSLVEKHESYKHSLVNIFRSNELLQLEKLEKLHVKHCNSLVEVFEVVEGTNNDMNETPPAVKFPELREMTLDYLKKLRYIWKSHQSTVLEFPNLTKVSIGHCDLLQHVFTCSMVGSLVQLQELHISHCKKTEVIVKEADVIEEDDEAKTKGHVLPCLKSLKLYNLMNLKGFCLGNDAFIFPSLDTLQIKDCPKITVFTSGASTTLKLNAINTNIGLFDAGNDPTSFIKRKIQDKGVYFGYDVDEDEED